MTPAQRDEELAFARAMLADPSDARLRAVYADWLSDEAGAVERAALVREAEGLVAEPYQARLRLGLGDDLILYSIWPRDETMRFDPSSIAIVMPWKLLYDPYSGRRFSVLIDRIDIRPDGSSPDDPHNWAWLLALAVSRGLVLPD
jgi:uncharacterized protein (TIGR02996 family)